MNPTVVDFIVRITNEALLSVIVLCGPPILLSMIIGLTISLFQAVTQLQEQTLTFVPKMVVIFGTIAALGSWMGGILLGFARRCFEGFPQIVG